VINARYGPVLYALVGVVLVATAASALQRYARAEGEVAVLEEQRDDLLAAALTLHAERDALREVGDSIGLVTDSLNLLLLAAVVVDVAEGDSVRIVIVNRIPPEFRLDVEALDDRRLATIARLQQVHVNDSTTVSNLRAQLFAERLGADEIHANDSTQIVNLEKQVAAFRLVAQVSWVNRSVGALKWVGAGVALCAALCPSE